MQVLSYPPAPGSNAAWSALPLWVALVWITSQAYRCAICMVYWISIYHKMYYKNARCMPRPQTCVERCVISSYYKRHKERSWWQTRGSGPMCPQNICYKCANAHSRCISMTYSTHTPQSCFRGKWIYHKCFVSALCSHIGMVHKSAILPFGTKLPSSAFCEKNQLQSLWDNLLGNIFNLNSSFILISLWRQMVEFIIYVLLVLSIVILKDNLSEWTLLNCLKDSPEN